MTNSAAERCLELAETCLRTRSAQLRANAGTENLPVLRDALVAVHGALGWLGNRKFPAGLSTRAAHVSEALSTLADDLLDEIVQSKP